MFERELFDAMPLWPTALWPAMSSALLFQYFWFNRKLQEDGVYIVDQYHPAFVPVAGLISLFGSVFETVSWVFFFYVIGWKYLLAIPLHLILGVVWFFVFAFMPRAHYLMPLAYVFCVSMTLTLIGVIDIDFIANLNGAIWNFMLSLARAWRGDVSA